MNSKKLIVIGGPTASGKTTLSIELANYYNCPILSADSRQFYREMSIGTAKPTPAELEQVQHYFINSRSIHDDYSVGDYERDALALTMELFKTNDYLILVGGSGLFIDALTIGLNEFPPISEATKAYFKSIYQKEGLAKLQALLKEADSDYYELVDLENPVRILRALEVCKESGNTFTSFRSKALPPRPFESTYFALDWERSILYDRINRRVDQMIQLGLLEEAKSLYPHRALNALQTVGYKELFEYLDNKLTLDEAIELVKRNSRRYAKRQMTWFKRSSKYHWLDTHTNPYLESALNYIKKTVR